MSVRSVGASRRTPLVRWVLGLDAFVARTRPAWWWVGQLAVVLLGVHLAADRLDDLITAGLVATGIPWPEPEQPITLGTWSAVLLELYVAGWAMVAWFRASDGPVANFRGWVDRATPHAIAAAVFWAPASLAGAWVIAMATEDLVAPWWATGASLIGWIAAAMAVWRLAWPGLVRVVRNTPKPHHLWDGILSIWPVVVVAGLAVRYGLPVWGWLP